MAEVLQLGKKWPTSDGVPPIEENTTWLDVGVLRIGYEYRVLTDDLLGHTEGLVIADDAPIGFDTEGGSIHVNDAATGDEYLRFDVFEGDAHYHYLTPGRRNWVIPFDLVAHGDMWEWVFDCLRRRLRPMLREAGALHLLDQVDDAAVLAAIPELERLAKLGRAGAVTLHSRA
jgi:hypothetical protein